MKTINEAQKNLYSAYAQFIQALEQIPEDYRYYEDIWEYKAKLQGVIGEWEELLKKWGEDEAFWGSHIN